MNWEEILTAIINGTYSDWVFNVFLTKVSIAFKNNLALLLVISGVFYKLAKLTPSKKDDQAVEWIRKRLLRIKEEKNRMENDVK